MFLTTFNYQVECEIRNVKDEIFGIFKKCSNCKQLFIDTLASLRQFLSTESPLKIMENAFYFTLKYLFVLKTFINFS